MKKPVDKKDLLPSDISISGSFLSNLIKRQSVTHIGLKSSGLGSTFGILL
jgi:hypothetical protein